MGLEKGLQIFQRNEKVLAMRPEQSDKRLLLTSGSNSVRFDTALKSADS